MTYTPRRGDFFITVSRSRIGAIVRFLQALVGDYTIFTHAGMVTTDQDSEGHQDIVEAMPGKAKLSDLSKYRSDPNTTYSWSEYLYLALAHWGWRTKWIQNRIKSSGHLICSQLVDQVYNDAGIQLFADGRISEDVTPGDLARILLTQSTHEDIPNDH